MERVEVQLGSKALQRLAKTLYSMDWSAIWVREIGLQNAIDACKNTGRKTEVRIDCVKKGDWVTLTVTDNGCGMDENIFKNSFMTIGETGKKDGVGGFGVASAVALSADECEVITNDLSWSSKDMMLRKSSSPITGTVVECRAKAALSVRHIINMVYLSDVDVHLHIEEDGKTVIDDPHAGAKWTTVKPLTDRGAQWTASIVETKLPAPGWSLKGANIYRMNGLVQFYRYDHDLRTSALRFDLTPTVRPGADGYPMNLSREELVGDTYTEVRKVIDRFNVDSISSVRKVDKPKETYTKINGYSFRSKRSKGLMCDLDDLSESEKDRLVEAVRNFFGSPNMSRYTAFNSLASVDQTVIGEAIEPERKDGKPAMLLINYEPKNYPVGEFRAQARLLDVWKEMVMLVADPDDVFAFGITTEDWVMAECRKQGISYYLLNAPKFLKQNVGGKEATVVALWHLACHECAHHTCETHNEEFASKEGELARITAQSVVDNLKRLAKML